MNSIQFKLSVTFFLLASFVNISNLFANSFNEGVCAHVRIRIDQEAVISRTAFRAFLSIGNSPENVPLDNVSITIDIRDEAGNYANSLFFIRDPKLTGITGVDGSGVIQPGTSPEIIWTIIPTKNAAVEASAFYSIGGLINYWQGDTEVRLHILPQYILVEPDANLIVNYFLEKYVGGDDPFTAEIEPPVPFSLGVSVTNTGGGIARNINITSAQPKIIENEKGLLVNLNIISSQVGSDMVLPSLRVSLGDIEPDQTQVARWIMQSSLQGEFNEYSATFQHSDKFGGLQTSLIESVEIHELIKVINADDDGKPDFLVNDIPDDNNLPDTIYTSQGSVLSVGQSLDATISGDLQTDNLQLGLDANTSSGWAYIRVNDPNPVGYRLIQIIRSDGGEIILGENAWLTSRTIREGGQAPVQENLLHILDNNSTGQYSMIYSDGLTNTNLEDVINILQICSGMNVAPNPVLIDLTGDDRIGIEEANIILQKIAGTK